MLYRGSEIMREVAWVVFDEIHYMRDASKLYQVTLLIRHLLTVHVARGMVSSTGQEDISNLVR